MKKNFSSKIVITGGHLTPAIASLNELKKRGYNKIFWIGVKKNQARNNKKTAEFLTIVKEGIPFFSLTTGKLIRNWEFSTFFYGLKQLFLIPYGFVNALILIIKIRPVIVISFGGFLALPVVFWAKVFRIKIVTHEQTQILGLANKLIAKLAHKVLISWKSSEKFFPKSKTVFTGNPIRREILYSKSSTLTRDFDKSRPILFVMGGNQGSHHINDKIFEILPKLLEDFNVIHQTGNSEATGDYTKALKIKESLNTYISLRYHVKDYIGSDEIGEALNSATIIVCRAGANTITELLATGKLSIIIPLPKSSYNEQVKNALLMESTGLGYYLPQKEEINAEKLYQTILMGLNQFKLGKGFNNKMLSECIETAKSMINLDAPSAVVDEIEKLLNKI